jgi:hypothetical protein
MPDDKQSTQTITGAAGHRADHPRPVCNRRAGSLRDWLYWLLMILMVLAFIIFGITSEGNGGR